MLRTRRASLKWWITISGLLVLAFVLAFGILHFRAHAIEEQIRQAARRDLGERFRSEVELEAIHIKFFPHMEVTGEGLTLRFHGRKDVPPLIHVEKFTFTAGILGLSRSVKHIPLLRVKI
jgi:hypothetical protein